jgi:hypothetical protein
MDEIEFKLFELIDKIEKNVDETGAEVPLEEEYHEKLDHLAHKLTKD